MDSRKLQFLTAVVGEDGARALSKAAERANELEQAIFPRAILAWLETVASFGFDGTVPGVSIPFTFSKTENGFNGSIAVNGELHRFVAASTNHLAGCVAVALGFDHERVSPLAKNEQLAKLGKSIDLLIKSQLVKVSLPGQKKKVQLPGQAAAPLAPKQPVAPTLVQPTNQNQAPAGAAGTAQATQLPKLPKVSAMPKKTASVTKSEAQKKCQHCMRPQFSGDKFKGCFCYAALAKSVKTIPTATGFTLEFGSAWDSDAILSLLETFKGK